MGNDSFASINLYKCEDNKKELLSNGVPLLFYWNGEDDSIVNSLVEDLEFYSLINDKCLNIDNYSNSKISFFMFKINGENYEDNTLDVQDIFMLKNLNKNDSDFYIEYIYNIFINLYLTAVKEKYNKDPLSLNLVDEIINIYEKLQKRFPRRFIKRTVINYLRSELVKTYKLNNTNTDWIIEQITEILKNEN